MSDTLVRHWHMLRLLPRAPRKIPTAEIETSLAERGLTVSRRSIQRDLQKLSGFFPIVCDERHKPYGWSWMRDTDPFDLPGMDLHTALAYRLASEHLAGLLPMATQVHLAPHFREAIQLIESLEATGLGRWAERVRVIHRHQPLRPPEIDAELLETVQVAVLEGRRLAVQYRRRGETAVRDYEVNPLALVFRESVPYLLCTFWRYTDVMQLVLHRIVRAELLEAPQTPVPGFDLDAFIAGGGFGFPVHPVPLALVLRVQADAGAMLHETPLSDDQRVEVEPEPPHWLRITATTPDTRQLRIWLRGFGPLAEVLEPAGLRNELRAEAMALATLYAGVA